MPAPLTAAELEEILHTDRIIGARLVALRNAIGELVINEKQLNRLWYSLTKLTTGKRARPELKPQFSRTELRAWLLARAEPGVPAWRCAYGAPGCSDGKFAIGITEVSLDHRTPVAKHAGGLTTLDNLAICCRSCQVLKRDLDAERFRELAEVLRAWPPNYRKSVTARLKQAPGLWVARQRAQQRAVAAVDEDF